MQWVAGQDLLEWKLNNDETVFIFSLDMLSTNILGWKRYREGISREIEEMRK